MAKLIKAWCTTCGTVTGFSAGKDEPDGKNVCQTCKVALDQKEG